MQSPYSRLLGDLLFEQAERYGDRPAVIATGVLSYADLAERAARIAAGLRERGIRRGDRVALLINNRPEWLEAFFGTLIAGGVVVALSTWSTADELDWLLQDAKPRVLVTMDRFGENDFVAGLSRLVPEATAGGDWRSARFPTLRHIAVLGSNGASSYDRLLSAPPLGRLAPGTGPRPADDAIIIYTSGSSSRPKSVPLAHDGIIENGFNIGERQGYGPDDRVLLAPPLFWSYGSANAMSATLTHGATLVLQSRFEAGEAIELIERHRCTALYTLPAITSAIISHPSLRPERVRSLRTGLTIGAPQDVITAATVLGAREICNVYGQTESYGNCCVTPHDWPLERRAACQGPPLPGVTCGSSMVRPAPRLPAGRRADRGPRLPAARLYRQQRQPDRRGDDRGRFLPHRRHGPLLPEGTVSFSGRVSEMIKKSGINISPAEVEDVLMRHPAVALAGVVGVPDPHAGRTARRLCCAEARQRAGPGGTRRRTAARWRRATRCPTSSRSAMPCR